MNDAIETLQRLAKDRLVDQDHQIALAAALRDVTPGYEIDRGQQWHWNFASDLQAALRRQGYVLVPIRKVK